MAQDIAALAAGIATGTAVITAAVIITSLWQPLLDQRTQPRVGDIIVFPGDAHAAGAPRLLVHRRGGFACVLDLNAVSRSQGSLVVEALEHQQMDAVHAHWAGVRTSADAGDCGGAADLLLDRGDLDRVMRVAARR